MSAQLAIEHEVCSNTQTVWVNSGVTGCCLGRFSKMGIDIHHDVDIQQETGRQCLDCTHTKPTVNDWYHFIREMLAVYDVHVDEEHRPEWINE